VSATQCSDLAGAGAQTFDPGGRANRAHRRATVAGAAIALLLALSLALPLAPPARASAIHPLITTFGAFAHPSGLGVDEASGNVFLADGGGNEAVDLFGPEGEAPSGAKSPITTYGGEGFHFGSEPTGVAVDNSSGGSRGDLYVTDTLHSRVVRLALEPVSEEYELSAVLTASPALEEPLGVDVGTNGDVYVADYGSQSIVEFDSGGSELGRIDVSGSAGNPGDVAVDSRGDVFVQKYGTFGSTVYKWAANGSGEVEAGTAPTQIVLTGATGVAVDQATDVLYLAMRDHVEQYDALTGADQGAFGAGTLSATERIAVNAASGDVYVSDRGNDDVAVFGPAIALPEASTGGAEAAETTATVHGTVNPEGPALTQCRFEYVTEAAFEASGFSDLGSGGSVPCSPGFGSIPADSSDHAVSAVLEGLTPGTRYRYRLAVANADGPSLGSDQGLFSLSPPRIAGQKAWSLSDASATLAATVNPEDSATHYRFEWTDEADFQAEGFAAAAATPVPDGTLAAGTDGVLVFARLSGLAPGAGYRFRVVAGNGVEADQVSAATAFVTRTSAESSLPQRGDELVSAADTNGLDSWPQGPSANGDRYVYNTTIPVPGSLGGTQSYFIASRSPDGSWSQRFAGAPAPSPGTGLSATFPFFSAEDPDDLAFATSAALDPDDRNEAPDVYRESPGGGFTWLSRDPSPAPGTAQTDPGDVKEIPYISADGSRVLFESNRHLLPADSTSGQPSLYRWDSGQLSLVARVPVSGSSCDDVSGPACTGSTGPSILGSDAKGGATDSAVSRDGSRVVFQTRRSFQADEQQRLYVRLDGQRTVEASASAPSAPALGGEAPWSVHYWGADEDDRTVFFTSSSPLTADSTAPDSSGGPTDLYAYDVDSGSLRDLTPAPGGAGVIGVYDVSADGGRVYFTATARLDGSAGEAGAENLYLWEGSSPHFIATVDDPASGFSKAPAGDDYDSNEDREAAADANGSMLAFRSTTALVPGRETAGRPQAYVYEAGSDALSCASCPADGTAPSAQAFLTPSTVAVASFTPAGSETGTASHALNVSGNGSVFFQTASSLLPADGNGKSDVYEWRGGELGLVSAGTGSADSIFAGATADGSTAFFRAADSLAPRAQAGIEHIYAARIGGGAAAPPTPTPPCQGSDCRAMPTTAPGGPSAGSALFSGPGNARARGHHHSHKNHRKKSRRKHRRQRTNLDHGGAK
jgi:NHL repeat